MSLSTKEVPKETGCFESFDSTQIYYEVHGQGQPIVFIYGVCCQMNHWHHQILHFSQTYRVIIFDIRGHHQSQIPNSNSNLSIEAVAKDVQALCAHLKIEKCHFVGHSFGVPVLIQLSTFEPDLTLSLCFINGFAKNPIKGMFGLDVVEPFYYWIKQQYDKAPALCSELWKVATNNPLAVGLTALAGGFNFKLTQFKDIEIYTRGVSQTPLKVFLPLFEDLMRFNGLEILRSINASTLIIAGEKDAVTPLNLQLEMSLQLKKIKYVIVPYGSHCTQLDFPDYVNLRLEAHLKEI